jgi:hypothetical protein
MRPKCCKLFQIVHGIGYQYRYIRVSVSEPGQTQMSSQSFIRILINAYLLLFREYGVLIVPPEWRTMIVSPFSVGLVLPVSIGTDILMLTRIVLILRRTSGRTGTGTRYRYLCSYWYRYSLEYGNHEPLLRRTSSSGKYRYLLGIGILLWTRISVHCQAD